MGIVCFLYHHFGIYKGIPKAAGSWVECKRKGGRKEGRLFSRFSLHFWKTGHVKLKNPFWSFLIDLVCIAPISVGRQTSLGERAILPC